MSPTEQRDAIRKMMANRRRKLAYIPGPFPKFEPGRTTTRAYVELYRISHPWVLDFGSLPDRVAPFITGPEVVVETEDDTEDLPL